MKSVYVRRMKMKDALSVGPLQNLALCCISGIINVFATAPFWVVNMRLKSDARNLYNGILDCFHQIVSHEGMGALWAGTVPSLVLVSNPIIHYCVYEYLKTSTLKTRVQRRGRISALEYFVMGAVAKTIATILTYPLQVAQSKLRVRRSPLNPCPLLTSI